ncbi:hypothetical protein [Rubrivirga sp.]|uniref:hypothetical protein n=1 Tax=Rubrivirga sp. TaxID=1885344 RepID=UPI003B51D2E6
MSTNKATVSKIARQVLSRPEWASQLLGATRAGKVVKVKTGDKVVYFRPSRKEYTTG